jgi:hypothetical protein
MAEWVEAIKLASVLYQEIFYAVVVRSQGTPSFVRRQRWPNRLSSRQAGRELEHCFAHWSDQANVFRKLAKEAVQQAR